MKETHLFLLVIISKKKPFYSIPSFKLKYEDSENVKADRVNTVVVNLHQIKRWALFLRLLAVGDHVRQRYAFCKTTIRTQAEQFGNESQRVKSKRTEKSSRPTVVYG